MLWWGMLITILIAMVDYRLHWLAIVMMLGIIADMIQEAVHERD